MSKASPRCIHEIFEAQVERTPDRIALVCEGQQLTYRELDQRANQLAQYLQKLGLGPEDLVGICVERSIEMVIGLIGILKVGSAYLPLDPGYPADRLSFILEDAAVKVLLTQERLMNLSVTDARVICLDRDWQQIAQESSGNPESKAIADNLAYVIYTSGSTGRPKGAMIPHRAIVNHIRWMQSKFPMSERDCVLQKTEFSFDVSVWEFFAPLIVGARLLVARPGGHRDPAYLVDLITQHQVTNLQLVPSLLRMLLEIPEFRNCHSLRHVFCGGETMTEDILRRFFGTLDAKLHNMYGPTEAAIDSIYYSVPRDAFSKIVPIGRPVANTRAYVLDRRRQPVPVGVPGELYLGGVQVGRGYHNQPELTAEQFIPDVFSNEQGARLYKTGDKARFLADGNIEFLGRIDHQVKIRGFRVELGEIEWALQQHPGVRESAVVARADAPGDKRLVAYVTPADTSFDLVGELQRFLKEKLPTYMVPSAIVLLNALPLTPNGKLDRKALPPPEGRPREHDGSYVAPRTPLERVLAGIWCDVLKLTKIGIYDNFFDLGGHSLLAMQLMSRIRYVFEVDFPFRSLFESPTVGHMAASLLRPSATRLQLERRAELFLKVADYSDSEVDAMLKVDSKHPGD